MKIVCKNCGNTIADHITDIDLFYSIKLQSFLDNNSDIKHYLEFTVLCNECNNKVVIRKFVKKVNEGEYVANIRFELDYEKEVKMYYEDE